MTPQEREREATERLREEFQIAVRLAAGHTMRPCVDSAMLLVAELIESVEARVRWDQQADAEGYTEGRP